MTIRTVHSELITLAAEMVRGEGLPSPYSDDHKWARTTSRTERIKVLRQYEQATEQAKNWAVRLRALADRLSSGGSSDETSGSQCDCWERISALIVNGTLPGDGTDLTAERNGVILAANTIARDRPAFISSAPKASALPCSWPDGCRDRSRCVAAGACQNVLQCEGN